MNYAHKELSAHSFRDATTREDTVASPGVGHLFIDWDGLAISILLKLNNDLVGPRKPAEHYRSSFDNYIRRLWHFCAKNQSIKAVSFIYLKRYLLAEPSLFTRRNQNRHFDLRALYVSCIGLAAKYLKEPLPVSTIQVVSKVSTDDILRNEIFVLKELNWCLFVDSAELEAIIAQPESLWWPKNSPAEDIIRCAAFGFPFDQPWSCFDLDDQPYGDNKDGGGGSDDNNDGGPDENFGFQNSDGDDHSNDENSDGDDQDNYDTAHSSFETCVSVGFNLIN